MSSSTVAKPKDLHTQAFVLRRTNYAESDRILSLLTPQGKVSAITKGVRKLKSKLAGNIELFCLLDIVVHQSKNSLAVLTSAKLLKAYREIIIDLPRLELASLILQQVNRASEHSDNPAYFSIVQQSLIALDQGANLKLIETWFWLNLLRASGEEPNFYRDTTGAKLQPQQTYVWDSTETALKPQLGGNIGQNEIKLLRLLSSSQLSLAAKIQNLNQMIDAVLYVAKALSQL